MTTGLARQLKEQNEAGRARIPAETPAVMEQATAEVASSGTANPTTCSRHWRRCEPDAGDFFARLRAEHHLDASVRPVRLPKCGGPGAERFGEPGGFEVRADGTGFMVAINSMLTARPRVEDLVGSIRFLVDNNYPPRGEA